MDVQDPLKNAPSPLSWWEQELAWLDQLLPQKPEFLGQQSEAAPPQAWKQYWDHFSALSPEQQKRVAYVLARRGCSSGTSGLRFCIPPVPYPFRFCGWANCGKDLCCPSGGVAFLIERGCFPDGPVRLFYTDNENWPLRTDAAGHVHSWGLEFLEGIRQFSSGISNVHLMQKRLPPRGRPQILVAFDLDPSIVRPVQIYDRRIPAKELGPYLFALPRCGEFNFALGEIRNGRAIILHRDSFCME